MNNNDFKEWLLSVGCNSAIDGYFSHRKGYSIIVEKANAIVKENTNYIPLHSGSFDSCKQYLEGVL